VPRVTPTPTPRDVTKGPVLPACRPRIDASLSVWAVGEELLTPRREGPDPPGGKDPTPRGKELDPSGGRT